MEEERGGGERCRGRRRECSWVSGRWKHIEMTWQHKRYAAKEGGEKREREMSLAKGRERMY